MDTLIPPSEVERPRAPVTALILCYNEERYIEDCIRSVRWANEVLVADSFSTDRTVELARRFADRVIQRKFDTYGVQQNWAIPQARHDWVLVVDADERATPELRDEIYQLLDAGPRHDGYWMARQNFLFGKQIRYSSWGRDYVLRFFRRDVGRYQTDKRVHERVQLANTGWLKARLAHLTVPSVRAWVAKSNSYSSWKAEDKYDKGMRSPIVHLVCRPPLRFLKEYVLRMGFLDGWRGFTISSMGAFEELAMVSKLIEMKLPGWTSAENQTAANGR